ncbi:hypothetical protein T08_5993, partial [Trichinella sp. T8]
MRITLLQLRRPRGPPSIQLPTPPTGRSQQEAVHVVAFTKPSSIFEQANVAGTDSQLLLDTGAAVTLIREDLFNSLSLKPELQPAYFRLLSASGDPLDVMGTCRLPIRFVAQSFAHTARRKELRVPRSAWSRLPFEQRLSLTWTTTFYASAQPMFISDTPAKYVRPTLLLSLVWRCFKTLCSSLAEAKFWSTLAAPPFLKAPNASSRRYRCYRTATPSSPPIPGSPTDSRFCAGYAVRRINCGRAIAIARGPKRTVREPSRTFDRRDRPQLPPHYRRDAAI